MAFQENRVWTEPTGRAKRHRRMNAVLAGFVARGGDDPPLIGTTADDDRLSAEIGPF